MLDFGPNHTQTHRNSCHQLTRVSKIPVFPQLAPFVKRPKQIGFSKFQMPYGSFLNAVHKLAVGFRFRKNPFFAILFRDPRNLREFPKRAPLTLLPFDLPSTDVRSAGSHHRSLPLLQQKIFRAHNM